MIEREDSRLDGDMNGRDEADRSGDELSRDLLVTAHTPTLRSGRGVRTYGLARALASHRALDLLYVRFGPSEPDVAFSSIPGTTLHEVVPSRGTHRALVYVRARLAGIPDALARGASPELSAEAARMADDPLRGRVIADGPIAAAALMRLASRRRVIYNAHNLESGFRHELLSERRHSQRRLRAFERRVLARFDESWMVSDVDIEGARVLCPQANLRYVPNVVDVSAIAPVQPDVGARRALFVASFHYEPNRVALQFMLDQVMPRVWARMADAKLCIVGAGLNRPPSSDPRVEALGFVDDLHSAYSQASCAVVPLLQGGGTPLKLIEALAHALPVIATPRAVGGLEARDGQHCLLASGAETFAASLLNVLRDGAPEIAHRGRELAERRYSIEALAALVKP